MQDSLGKIVVLTPGVPVRATKNRSEPTDNFYVHGYVIQRLAGNVGAVYVSLSSADNRATLSRIVGRLDSSQPSISGGMGFAQNGINMSDLYIDADNGNDGVTISVLIA